MASTILDVCPSAGLPAKGFLTLEESQVPPSVTPKVHHFLGGLGVAMPVGSGSRCLLDWSPPPLSLTSPHGSCVGLLIGDNTTCSSLHPALAHVLHFGGE
jgi:hypothetical protein